MRQLQSQSTNGRDCRRTGVLSSPVEPLCDGASDGDGPVALDEASTSTDDGPGADADAAVSSGAAAALDSSGVDAPVAAGAGAGVAAVFTCIP